MFVCKRIYNRTIMLFIVSAMVLAFSAPVIYSWTVDAVTVMDEFGFSLEDPAYLPTVASGHSVLNIVFQDGAVLDNEVLGGESGIRLETVPPPNHVLSMNLNGAASGTAVYEYIKVNGIPDSVAPSIVVDTKIKFSISNGYTLPIFLGTDYTLATRICTVYGKGIAAGSATPTQKNQAASMGVDTTKDFVQLYAAKGYNTMGYIQADDWVSLRLIYNLSEKTISAAANGHLLTSYGFSDNKITTLSAGSLCFGIHQYDANAVVTDEKFELSALKITNQTSGDVMYDSPDMTDWQQSSERTIINTGTDYLAEFIVYPKSSPAGTNSEVSLPKALRIPISGEKIGSTYKVMPDVPLEVGSEYSIIVPENIGGEGFPATDKKVKFLVVGDISELDRPFASLLDVTDINENPLTDNGYVDINNEGFKLNFDRKVLKQSLLEGINLEAFKADKVMRVTPAAAWKTSTWTLPDGWLANGDSTLTFELRVLMDQPQTVGERSNFYGVVHDSGIGSTIDTDNARVDCDVDTAGRANIKSRGGSAIVEFGTWHTIKIVYTLDKFMNAIYIDDALQSTAANSGNGETFSGIGTYLQLQTQTAGNMMYIDYIKIYGDKYGHYIDDYDHTQATKTDFISGLALVESGSTPIPFDISLDADDKTAMVIPAYKAGYNYTYRMAITDKVTDAGGGYPILNPQTYDVRHIWAHGVVAVQSRFENSDKIRLISLKGHKGEIIGIVKLENISGAQKQATLLMEVTVDGEQAAISANRIDVLQGEHEYMVKIEDADFPNISEGIINVTIYVVDNLGDMNVLSPEFLL